MYTGKLIGVTSKETISFGSMHWIVRSMKLFPDPPEDAAYSEADRGSWLSVVPESAVVSA